MSNEARIVRLNLGGVVVEFAGQQTRASDEEQAGLFAEQIDRAYRLGKRAARAEVRAALGLRAWGGDVRCTDN